MIREYGCKVGLAFNPATPLHYLEHLIDSLDLILIMSVNPGFGGQKFIPGALTKLRSARRRIEASGRDIWLEVDGGVNADNIGEAAQAGADTFVAGSAIFGTQGLRRHHRPRCARASCRPRRSRSRRVDQVHSQVLAQV